MQKGKVNMSIVESLQKRRSIYALGKELPVSQEEVQRRVEEITELVPDAFNMKSARLILLFGEKHELLWDATYEVFGGKVPRDKIDSFKAGAGTVLFFYDKKTVEAMQEQFPLYAENFPVWANQANGMLQISVWSGLRELNLGASLQHYNPIINDKVRELFRVPEGYELLAEMPFGNILSEPDAKAKENISERVVVFK